MNPLPFTTDVTKKSRGTFVSAECNGGVLKCTKWNDNQIVIVLYILRIEKRMKIKLVVGQEKTKKLSIFAIFSCCKL